MSRQRARADSIPTPNSANADVAVFKTARDPSPLTTFQRLNNDSAVQIDLRYENLPKRDRHRKIRQKLQQHVEELAIETYDMTHKWDQDEIDVKTKMKTDGFLDCVKVDHW